MGACCQAAVCLPVHPLPVLLQSAGVLLRQPGKLRVMLLLLLLEGLRWARRQERKNGRSSCCVCGVLGKVVSETGHGGPCN